MKTRLIIIACWLCVVVAFEIAKLLPSFVPAILPGIVLLFFHIFIPSASPKFKQTAICAFVATIAASLLFFIPLGVGVAVIGSVVFFVTVIWSDILVFKRHETVA